MISAQTVTKNSFFSLSSSVMQKLLTLAYFIIVARVFGPEEQGRYSAALAFATLFGVLIDMGLASALTRETARDVARAKDFLGQMFLARIALGVVVYGLIVGSAVVFGYSQELVSMIVVAGVASVIDVMTNSCWFLLRGFRNLLYESIGSVAAVLAMVVVGSIALVMGYPVIALVYAVLFGSCVNLAFALFTVFFRARIPLLMAPNWKTLRFLAVISLPFAGAAIFSRIYTFADVILLAKFSGEQAVGWYSAGNKLILALNIIPAALSASLYPALSSYCTSAPHKLEHLVSKALFFLLLISAPIGFGITMTASSIVMLFYGADYLPTIPVLQLLGASLLFGYLSYPFGSLLAATNRQKTGTFVMGIVALVNIVFNIIFIHRYGAVGSALASVVAMIALVCLSAWFSRKVFSVSLRPLMGRVAKILFSASVMAIILGLLEFRGAPLGVLIFVGACVYAGCILITRTLTGHELREIRAAFFKRSS
ncbi:flippase [Candidatus Uhrbacteria bacterium]|nr:flippase [Candidatus Uhrbacteria bacterium]